MVDIRVLYYFFTFTIMWLAEKRVIKQYHDEVLPKVQEEIKNIVGVEIPMDIQWETLPVEGSAGYLMEGLEKVYFKPIVEAIKAICIDELWKSALAVSLRKIYVKNGENTPANEGQLISFENGVLTVNQRLSNLDNDYEYRISEITRVFEAWL